MRQPLFKHACEQAFLECDVEGNDYISEEQVSEFMFSSTSKKKKIHMLTGGTLFFGLALVC